MIKGQMVFLVLLAMAVLFSALGVVYSKHHSRKLFVELQSLEGTRDRLNVEWGQLQLEQSTWAAPNRVEQVARTRLGMDAPKPDQIVIVSP
ncbi:MAG: cell division protein FtsL [Thiotrichaceae bacterium]|nr:cell division protein FtsL [Thiotrichaceae bacterium]PCI10620.1 MAG: cell division protein FtsL [Thiotrichales bacterium]PCI11732.1 MAG: cell division protein FtsL [Thiotrichales bacterium]